MNPNRIPRIVAFTKDWNDVPTCTTHILRLMGRDMPVLWIESIGTRKASLAVGKDWRRVWRRLRRVMRGAELKENHLRVLAPVVIPKAESRLGRGVNRWLIRWQIGRELRRMGSGPVEYWCFVPNAVDLLPPDTAARETTDHRLQTTDQGRGETTDHRPQTLDLGIGCETPELDACDLESRVFPAACGLKSNVHGLRSNVSHAARVIYYCVDDWSQFHNLDGAWLSRKEEELLLRADVVFAASRFLVGKCRRVAGDKVVYMPHGVDYALFSQALNPDLEEPDDLKTIPHPRIGFYGNLHPWVDFELLVRLAKAHAEWHFVLIGEIYCDVSRLQKLSNVHFLGRREHCQLPAYCNGFDVGIIPYDMTQTRMESVSPVKTKELLAAGVPVMTADIPELRRISEDVTVCRSQEEWERALGETLDVRRQTLDWGSRRQRRVEISKRVAGKDWQVKVREIRAHIDERMSSHAGLNILYHFRTRATGAESVHIAGIATAFEQMGHRVVFSCPTGEDPRATAGDSPYADHQRKTILDIIAKYCPGVFFELIEVIYNIPAYWRNRMTLGTGRIDLIYERHAFFLASTAWLANRYGVPLIVEVNELVGDERVREQPWLAPVARWTDRFVFCRATLIVAVSPHLKRRIAAQGIPEGKIVIMPNAVDKEAHAVLANGDAIRRQLGLEGKKVVGFTGWFVAWHRLDLLLRAFATVAASREDVRLLLIGEGPRMAELQEEARRLGIGGKTVFGGARRHGQMPSVIAAMDVCVVPHSNEYRSPIKLFEYMGQGKLVVVPDTEPIRMVVRHDENGLLFPVGDEYALAEAISVGLDDVGLRSMVGSQARKDVLDHFTWDRNARKVLDWLAARATSYPPSPESSA